MKSDAIVRVDSALICEDVRREDNGKLLLIGTFGHDIVAAGFPATLLLTLVAIFDVDSPGTAKFTIRVLLNGESIREGSGQIEFGKTGSHLSAFGGLLLKQMSEPGLLEFQIKIDDGEWRTIRKMPLTCSANAVPISAIE